MDYRKKHEISVYLTEEQLNRRIAEIGAQITERFAGESVYLVCILKGSVFFTTELAKRIALPMTIDFMWRLFSECMPTAAAVPIAVASIDELTARIRVFIKELIVSSFANNSRYHLSEKPVKTAMLFDSLNEKNMRTIIGA